MAFIFGSLFFNLGEDKSQVDANSRISIMLMSVIVAPHTRRRLVVRSILQNRITEFSERADLSGLLLGERAVPGRHAVDAASLSILITLLYACVAN